MCWNYKKRITLFSPVEFSKVALLNLCNFDMNRPTLLRLALTDADPALLEIALTKATPELLKVALTKGVNPANLRVALTEVSCMPHF